jgi:low affinity Fe/Cu permease
MAAPSVPEQTGPQQVPSRAHGRPANILRRLAQWSPQVVGSSWTFAAMLLATSAWLAVGPVVGFSDAWLLVPSAVASIIALLLVVLLQYSQNRDTRVLQLKLDELIRSIAEGRTQLLRLEHESDEALGQIEQEFQELREEAETGGP